EVGTPDGLAVTAVGLAVRERLEHDVPEFDAELLGDRPSEARMGAAREDHQPLRRAALEPVPDAHLGTLLQADGLEPGKAEGLSRRRALGGHTPPCSPGVAGNRPARPEARPR